MLSAAPDACGTIRRIAGAIAVAAVVLLVAPPGRAQPGDSAAATAGVLEQVVLRRSLPGRAPPNPGTPPARTVIGVGASLESLVAWAYGVPHAQVTGGPDWIDARLFDVVLVFAPGAEDIERAAALRALLAERFELEARLETVPVYILDTTGRTTLESVDADAPRQSQLEEAPGRIVGRAVTAGALAAALARYLGRPVLDHTALAARYDFTLEWPLEQPLDETLADGPDGAAAHANLVAALESRLGLELRSFPLEQVVVTRAVQPTLED